MKKVIVSVLVTMCVMAIIGIGVIKHFDNLHKSEIDAIRFDYNVAISQRERDAMRIEELKHQICNIMEGEEYYISFGYDGVYYTYAGEFEDTVLGIETLNTWSSKTYY